MENNFTIIPFDRVINVEAIVTLFYMEMSKNFSYEGEQHDFWEMMYIDKGELICTADEKQFVLKSGEVVFHKPNEYHKHVGNNVVEYNTSIVAFRCRSRAMRYFEGKIFKLNAEEKALLSMLFAEGRSCYRLEDEKTPLQPRMKKIESAPYGSSQITKNLLEIFLLRLHRHTDVLTKDMRESHLVDGVDIPHQVKEILDFLQENLYAKIAIRDIARHIGKSESSVKQLFSQYRSGGVMRYYNSQKIKEARRLIREGKYNMNQISDMLCFDNSQYFCKCFKSFTKMTPREYKNSILRE